MYNNNFIDCPEPKKTKKQTTRQTEPLSNEVSDIIIC